MGTVKNFGGLNSPVAEVEGGTNAKTFNAARTNMGLNPLVVGKTLTYNVVSSDRGTLIHYTGAGGVDLTLDPAATLGNGFNFVIRNDSSGNITINPNGAETINGAATLAVEPTQAVTVICSGTAFFTEGQAAQVDGANVALSNLASTAVNIDIVPAIDGGPDLGNSSHSWGTVYTDTLSDDTLTNTQTHGTNDDTIATTAFVAAAIAGVGGGSITFPPSSTSSKSLFGNFSLAAVPGLFTGTTFSNSQTDFTASQLNTSVVFVPYFAYAAYSSLTQIRLNVAVGVAASTLTAGLYASNASGLPTGSALAVGQVATTSTGGVVISGLSVALTANTMYWFAIQCSTATTLSLTSATLSINAGFNNNGGPGTTLQQYWITQTNTYSAGTLPTIGTLVLSGGFMPSLPLVWFI